MSLDKAIEHHMTKKQESGNMTVIEQKPMTNADAIRQMTDDELYEFLLKVQIGDIDYSVAICDICTKDGGNELGLDCDGCFKHWLKQDAETHYQGLHTPCGLNSDI